MVNRLSRRSGDDVPVIGADDAVGGGEVQAESRSPRSWSWSGRVLAAVAVATLGVTVIIGLVGDEDADSAPTEVSMALPAPVEPSVVTTAPEPEPPEFALGWKQLELPGFSGGGFGKAIDAGPSGWIGVTHGDYGRMVHTSSDAVGWRTTTLDELGWIPTVFSGDQGLFVAMSGGAAGAGIWRSVDGGIGWERSTLPGDEPVVVSVSEAAGRVWAAGMVSSPDGGLTGTPAVWVLDGDDWNSVPLEGERGWVASVVEWEGGVWGFGSDRGSVVWDLLGSERFAVPAETGLGGFRTVVAHHGFLWGLFSPGLTESGRLVTALDPLGWRPAPSTRRPSGLMLEPMGEQLAVVDWSRLELVSGVGQTSGDETIPVGQWIPTRIPGHTTGLETATEVAGLAVAGEKAVFLGSDSNFEASLWAQGAVSEPIVLLDPDQMVWSARRQLGAFVWGGGPVDRWDGRIFMQGPSGVSEWVFGTDLVEVPGGREAFGLEPTEAGLLAVGSAGVMILKGSEFVDFGPMPNREPSADGPEADALCNAGVVEGLLWVTDCGGRMWERDANGVWSQTEPTGFRIVRSLDGAFLAYDPNTGEQGITVDGATLELRGQVESGFSDPFVILERRSGSAMVRMIEPWPGGVTFQVPTPAPLEVSRVGETLRVQSPSTLYISTDQGRSWTEVPIGIENGFPLGGVLLPTETLMVIAPNPEGSASVLYTPRP